MIYMTRDLETDDGGEIVLENGDLKVASVKRSHIQALNWLLASNRGDVLDGDTVADLGSWFGRLNIDRNHRSMESECRRAISEQKLFGPGDVRLSVVPIGPNVAAVTARMFGTYIEPIGLEDDALPTFLGYVFSFGVGQLQRVSG